MISAYASILQYQYDEWAQYFDKIGIMEVFKPILKCYTDKIKLKCVIRYILHCYSVESEKVILGQDWQKNKQSIFEDTCTPMKDLYEDLVLLRNDAVVETVNNWLSFQNNSVHEEISMLRDLKMEMQISANSRIIKSSGEVDYDQKYKNSNYVTELRKKIKDLESEFVQNNEKLKEAVKEFKIQSKSRNTLRPERFAQ